MPGISVVICTYNPNLYVLDWALECLNQQTLPPTDFEVVVVDNNSPEPLQAEALKRGRPLNLRVVRESRHGVLFARCRGIAEAEAPLLVFADDDNGLAANYLEEALRIARLEPSIGAFSGVTRLLTDVSIPAWKKGLLPFLGVRDYGPVPITSTQPKWGEWEPIGAGMVFRREIGLKFIAFANGDVRAQELGRRGNSYICGEDSLLARVACWNGYACSYQPSLALTHFIRRSRLSSRELAKTIEGCAQAWVINEHLCGRPQPPVSPIGVLRELWATLRHRTKQTGFRRGLLEWFWDVGQLRQARAYAKKASASGMRAEHSADTGA